jgi:hypothetical protein
LEQKINEWNKLVHASPKFKQQIVKAGEFINQGLSNLPQQAEFAKQNRLTALRENIADLSNNGELLQFEIDYLKRNFSCFTGETIGREISNCSRSLTSNMSGIANNEPNISLRDFWGIMAQSGIGKWVIFLLIFLVLLYPASYLPGIVAGMLKQLPSLPNISGSKSYERGVGSYINSYVNHSYDDAKWEII